MSVRHSIVSNSLQPHVLYPRGSTVHGILQARILGWVAIPFSRASSRSRNQTWVSCIAGGFFTIWATREGHHVLKKVISSFIVLTQNSVTTLWDVFSYPHVAFEVGDPEWLSFIWAVSNRTETKAKQSILNHHLVQLLGHVFEWVTCRPDHLSHLGTYAEFLGEAEQLWESGCRDQARCWLLYKGVLHLSSRLESWGGSSGHNRNAL